jgi:hypothetical protein
MKLDCIYSKLLGDFDLFAIWVDKQADGYTVISQSGDGIQQQFGSRPKIQPSLGRDFFPFLRNQGGLLRMNLAGMFEQLSEP